MEREAKSSGTSVSKMRGEAALRATRRCDAAAFYGLAILRTAPPGGHRDVHARAGVLEEAWRIIRDHPGLVHYLIHSYDDPAHAPSAWRAGGILREDRA